MPSYWEENQFKVLFPYYYGIKCYLDLFGGYNTDASVFAKPIPCTPSSKKLRSQQSTDNTSFGSQSTQISSALLENK